VRIYFYSFFFLLLPIMQCNHYIYI
jgi:hypothetical protein